MMDQPYMETCFLCGEQFQFSAGVYAGAHISGYKVMVCGICYDGNREGWASHREWQLIAHLKREGTPVPPRNAQGWLPREF